jgi:hypothetical protein
VFPFAALGGVDRNRRINAYAGKLTAQINSSNRLDVSVFGDPSKGEAGLQRTSALRRLAYPGAPGTTSIEGGFSELEYGAHNQSVRYDGIFGSRWLVEGSIAHSDQKFHETPSVNDWIYTDVRTFVGPACGLTGTAVCPQGTTGGLGFFENNDGKNKQYAAKSTNIFNAGGSHEVRYGVQFEDIDFHRGTNYSGPPMKLADGRTTVTGGPLQIRPGVGGATFYRATRGLLVPSGDNVQKYTSVFLQDTFQTGRLTVRPGVRYERQHLTGIEPGNGFPELCHADDTRPGLGDGSGPAVACEFTWNNVAPRIGATFDLTGTGRAKVFANWGRFYAKIPNDLAARAMSADTGITRQNFVDGALTQAIPNGPVNAVTGSGTNLILTSDAAATIDPDAKSTYTDEFLAGVEFEVFNGANLGFRYTRRTLPSILEDIGQLPIAGYLGFLTGNPTVDYFITNVNADTPVVQCCGYNDISFEDPQHKYDAFEITLNKRFGGRWSALSSYRFSRLRGNFEGFYRSDNGQSDPSISSLFDFPTNDPSYTALVVANGLGSGDIRYEGCSLGCGILPNERPHQLKLYGSSVWGPVNIGLGFNAGSGASLTALASNPVYANAGEIPLTLRGEGMQTVDGFKKRAAADLSLDLHADYSVSFGGRRILFLADAFNLFNRQAPLYYDNWYETTVGTLNPNFGQPIFVGGGTTPSFQSPFNLRFGARFDW